MYQVTNYICYLCGQQGSGNHQCAQSDLLAENIKLRTALEKIYNYRSDKPDWNMVMAIAEDAIAPKTIVMSGELNREGEK